MSLFPEIIELELSNRCNLDCVMCPRLPQKLNMGDMDRALLDRVLDESLAHPRRTFRLHGIGEPLLSPHFRHTVERIKNTTGEHRIDLITNGHLLSKDTGRFILRQEIDRLTVSVAAATPETYAVVRKSKKLDLVLKNTIRLLDEKARTGAATEVVVQLIRVPPADQEVDAFVEFWSRFDVTIEIWHDLNWGRRAFGAAPTLEFPPCEHLYRYSVVCWDGRVGICCVDASRMHVVGHLEKESLREAFNSQRMQAIRAIHERQETFHMPICVDCSFRDERHIAFSANTSRSGTRPGDFAAVPPTDYGLPGPNSDGPLVQLPSASGNSER
ncbi:MAG: radical SAM/SPASM domain-containing protein [Myxococcota bacterium]